MRFLMAHLKKTRVDSEGFFVEELCAGGLTKYLMKLYVLCEMETLEKEYKALLRQHYPTQAKYHYESREYAHQKSVDRISG